MNKKIKIIICLLVFILALSTPLFINKKANSETKTNSYLDFDSRISAVSPLDNETITILNESLNAFVNLDEMERNDIESLYSYSSNHKEFINKVNSFDQNNNQVIKEIYDKTDDFKPVNNVLKWDSTIENITSYTVRVSLDSKFTKTILKVIDASVTDGVVLENPYTNTRYYWQVIAKDINNDLYYSNIFSFYVDGDYRTVSIDGVSNSRDIGGKTTEYGYIKEGLIYRSARLESVTTKGLETVHNNLKIKTELDLRGVNESTGVINKQDMFNLNEGYKVVEGKQYVFLSGDTTADENMNGAYINFKINYSAVKDMMMVFTDINNYPIIFHCAVGRDRTGTCAVLLEALLGYTELEIRKDYFMSLFSTTGAWEKGTDYLSINSLIEYLKSLPGDTLSEKTKYYLINKCLMTENDVNSIIGIMIGNSETSIDTIVTIVDDNNYNDYSFVTFNNYGSKTVTKMVQNGTKVVAPYSLGDGYNWFNDGVLFDFDTLINEDITLEATKEEYYTVNVIVNGLNIDNYTLNIKKNAELDFNQFEISGYNLKVMLDDGKFIKNYIVTRDTTINLIYNKK